MFPMLMFPMIQFFEFYLKMLISCSNRSVKRLCSKSNVALLYTENEIAVYYN